MDEEVKVDGAPMEEAVDELVAEETLPENEAPVDTAEEVVEPADVEVPAEETPAE